MAALRTKKVTVLLAAIMILLLLLLFWCFHIAIDAAILRRKHGGDTMHHFFGGIVDIFTRYFVAFGFEDYRFTVRDGDFSTELLQRIFTTPDRHRDHRHLRAQCNHTQTGMSLRHCVCLAACPFGEDYKDLAFF